ncbi:MAG TPA: redoxin domain-containing protein [Gemmatimonadetes bacterium]|nr:redoxin domain-containing protein [Gemmatimonadota bacterium]
MGVDPNVRFGEQLLLGASFSGHERNHLFLNQDRVDYVEVSGVSGLDHLGDSRAFAVLDYDRDGWHDIAMVNANAPLFTLYRNQMGEREGARGGMVAVRFEGGNRSSAVSDRWSARDGYGAHLLLEIGGRTLLREHRAGEGLAAQNSATLRVGIGEAERADQLEIRWPSGRSSDTTAVPVGTLVTAYENPSDSPTGTSFVFTPYGVPPTATGAPPAQRPLVASSGPPAQSIRAAQQVLPGSRGRLIMYTTVATWCLPCLDELPALNLLRATFPTETLEIFGVPYDEDETLAAHEAWSDLYEPPYQILFELSSEQRESVIGGALDALRVEGLPAAVVTDSEGEVLLVRWGPPSISEIHMLLEGLGDAR